MARIENTVFISYRRTDVYTALAVYENLKNQGYDVFFDYRSISSGDFEQIITGNIRARAHFLLILTPTALDRCNEPGDWLRREIELAIDEKRNIVPLFFKGFRFGASSKSGVSKWMRFGKPDVLTGKLKDLSRYNGLNVHEDYFEEAMQRVRADFLNKPLDTVLHPVSTLVRKVVKEEQDAADKALMQKEVAKDSIKQIEDKPVEKKELPKSVVSKPEKAKIASSIPMKAIPWRKVGGVAGTMAVIALYIWGGVNLWNNNSFSERDSTNTPVFTKTSTSQPIKTNTPAQTIPATSIPLTPTPTLGIGSTRTGEDGMTLLYVPAGEFTMGDDGNTPYEKPTHTVYLDGFWVDKTEITNKIYMLCVSGGACKQPVKTNSSTRPVYYGHLDFDNYPVIYVDWNMANAYCEWAGRRLPTEAEWEKAARGVDERRYPWGEKGWPYDGLLNYDEGDTTKVGSFPDGASPYGVLDMAGNVLEWVADWYSGTYYAISPNTNPSGPSSGDVRIVRGGTWYRYVKNFPTSTYYSQISVGDFTTTYRFGYSTSYSAFNLGFRCVMDATP